MNQTGTAKIVVALLAVVLVMTIFASTQSPAPLKIDDSAMLTVSQASTVWSRNFGGATTDDRAFGMLPVGGDYIVVGSTTINNTKNGWAIMLDSGGNTVWNQTYLSGEGTELRCALPLSDGFLLVGNVFLSGGDQNGYCAKVDCQGNTVWQKTYGGTELDKVFGAAASDGYFYIYGLQGLAGGLQADWVVKVDGDGNVVWDKTYVFGADNAFRGGAVVDDALVAAGYVDHWGDGDYDFALAKISSDGALMWNKTYGGLQSDKAYSMTTASDGYVLVGEVESSGTSTNAWVVKTDFDGVMQWAKTLGGQNADSPSYVTTAKDGGILVCGFTFSFGAGQRDFWLFKLAADGQPVFSCTYGSESFQEAYSVTDLGGNHYVVAGWTDPPGNADLVGKAKYDFLVAEISVYESSGAPINLWLTAASIVSAAALVATLVLLLKIKTKKQK